MQNVRQSTKLQFSQRNEKEDFPGGTVDKDMPANAGHMGSIPGPGKSHMLPSN